MSKLVLGTAQLGLNYGINNVYGKPSKQYAFDILDAAANIGIGAIDTAPAYGDAERIIGEYIKDTSNSFKIATKLTELKNKENVAEQVRNQIDNSLCNLSAKRLDYYFLHSFNDLIETPEILRVLQQQKELEKLNYVGVSIYNVAECEYILENLNGKVDIIQIPFNAFDQSWLKNDVINRVNEKGITIFARSIFLQGLFFTNESKALKIHSRLPYYLNKVRDFCTNRNITINEFLIGYVKYYKSVDYIIIGCESVEQIINNHNIFESVDVNLSEDINKFAIENFSIMEKEIIDPRLWNLQK